MTKKTTKKTKHCVWCGKKVARGKYCSRWCRSEYTDANETPTTDLVDNATTEKYYDALDDHVWWMRSDVPEKTGLDALREFSGPLIDEYREKFGHIPQRLIVTEVGTFIGPVVNESVWSRMWRDGRYAKKAQE